MDLEFAGFSMVLKETKRFQWVWFTLHFLPLGYIVINY